MGGVIVFVIKNNIFFITKEKDILRETEHLYRGTERNI